MQGFLLSAKDTQSKILRAFHVTLETITNDTESPTALADAFKECLGLFDTSLPKDWLANNKEALLCPRFSRLSAEFKFFGKLADELIFADEVSVQNGLAAVYEKIKALPIQVDKVDTIESDNSKEPSPASSFNNNLITTGDASVQSSSKQQTTLILKPTDTQVTPNGPTSSDNKGSSVLKIVGIGALCVVVITGSGLIAAKVFWNKSPADLLRAIKNKITGSVDNDDE